MESVIMNKSKFQISELTRERIVIAMRWICMALFIYTAYAKTIDHDRFLKGLTRVHLINGLAVFISFVVPVVEFIIALLLLIPKTAKIGLYCFIAVMTAFTFYIISAIIWEKTLPCHCGGAIEKLSWSQHIWFNLAFISIAIFALRFIKLSTSFKNLRK
ncbi:MAG: MauE/DoxX family redox-associated membrane protein [Bacteroidota bacterium]